MTEPNKELRPVSEIAKDKSKIWHLALSEQQINLLENDFKEALNSEREYWQELLAQKLSAVSVASISNTTKSMEETKIERDNPFWSVAYEDVRTAIKREIELREKFQHWFGVAWKLAEALRRNSKDFKDFKLKNSGHICEASVFLNAVFNRSQQAIAELEAVKGRKKKDCRRGIKET